MAIQGRGYTGSEVATKAEVSDFIYSDLNFYFTPSPLFVEEGKSGDVVRVFDANSIKQSIRNILFTNKYERPFNSNFGCGTQLRQLLFNSRSGWNTFVLQDKIKKQLQKYEPRIRVNNISIKENKKTSSMFIGIDYETKNIEGQSIKDRSEIKISIERI